MASFIEHSKIHWHRGANPDGYPGDNGVIMGSLQRLARAAEEFNGWARSFRGCRMANDINKITTRGITIRHVWRVEIRIRWPWVKRRKR